MAAPKPRPAAPATMVVVPGEAQPETFTALAKARLNPARAMQSWMSDLKSYKLYQAVLGEFLGTTFFLFAVTTAVVFTFPFTSDAGLPSGAVATTVPRIVLIAATFGLTITAMVFVLSHISGGHLNPAVTCALWLRGSVTAVRGVLYVLAQMAVSNKSRAFRQAACMQPSQSYIPLSTWAAIFKTLLVASPAGRMRWERVG